MKSLSLFYNSELPGDLIVSKCYFNLFSWLGRLLLKDCLLAFFENAFILVWILVSLCLELNRHLLTWSWWLLCAGNSPRTKSEPKSLRIARSSLFELVECYGGICILGSFIRGSLTLEPIPAFRGAHNWWIQSVLPKPPCNPIQGSRQGCRQGFDSWPICWSC